MSAKPIPETAHRQDWPRLVAAANRDHEDRIKTLEAGGGGGGGVSDGDKGDVVVSGSGTVWTVDGLTRHGSLEVDFGATPTDTASASAVVASLSAASPVRLWIQGTDTTADNTASDHAQAAATMALVPSAAVNTISVEAFAMHGLATGKFKVRYSYA